MDKLEYLNMLEISARSEGVPVILGDSKVILLQEIARHNPTRILEIGTAVGYSGGLMLMQCQGILDTVELDKERYARATKTFHDLGFADRVNQYLGDAMEVIDTLQDRRYDFIFMDGPKSKYSIYLDKLMPCLNTGGIVFADNVLFRGMVKGDELPARKHRTIVLKLREYLAKIMDKSQFDTQLYEIGDGIAVTKKLR